MAGCILVDFENLQVINRSHAYRNVYVHRRDSVSIAKLSKREIEERMRLGLVTESDDAEYEEEEEYEDVEEWEDMETEDHSEEEEGDDDDVDNDVDNHNVHYDEESYVFSNRRSSVIPEDTMSSPPDKEKHNDSSRWSDILSKVDTNDRRQRRECQRLSVMTSTIEEEDGSDEGMEYDDDEKKSTRHEI